MKTPYIDKACYVFPGQGSQFVGMGKELYSNNKNIFEKKLNTTNKILGYDLGFDITNLIIKSPEEILIKNPEKKLKETIYSQLAILLYSLVCFEVLSETKGISCLLTLGHSIGEYSALVASEALSLEDALKLVKIRAESMTKCIPAETVKKGTSHMAAVLNEKPNLIDLVEKACKKSSLYKGNNKGIVQVANKNSPYQIIISGNNNAVIRAIKYLKKRDIKKIIYLPVEGPFHSELMRPAAEKMKEELEKIKINRLEIPSIRNNGELISKTSEPHEIKEALVNQICGTVEWEKSLKLAINMGIKTFIECGPGKKQFNLLNRDYKPNYKGIKILTTTDYI